MRPIPIIYSLDKRGDMMDLGIKGRRALVCAGSKGLGRGCALALAQAGVGLVLNARGADALAQAADAARAFGVQVTPVAGDITTEAGRAAVLAQGPFDILITNAGGPPAGQYSDWSRDDFIKALDANMLTPIALMQACLPHMIAQGWGRVVNITSQSVKAPIGVLGLSNNARTGLTGFVAGTARTVARHGVCINNLLPGSHDTDRIASLNGAEAAQRGVPLAQVYAERAAEIPAGRIGTPAEFGAMAAFLCSQHAGFIVGQNILLDGGAVNATI
jgi:3-oxoacyl-[acyl-carrier protein] reductase